MKCKGGRCVKDTEESTLTIKQKRFCDFYIATLNATDAAKKAGYSDKTAYAIGVENLSKPLIKSYIEKQLKSVDNSRIASRDEVLEYLTSVMRREHNEHSVLKSKGEEPIIVKYPAKLVDSNKAAELLGRRYALFDSKDDTSDIEDLSPLAEMLK